MSNMVYCRGCGKQIDESDSFCPHCGTAQKVMNTNVNPNVYSGDNVNMNPNVGGMSQKRLAAALFAFFLGGFGIHKFYLGQVGMGILYLLFCWTGIPFIVGFIEGIIYICMSDADFTTKYGR
ncbi:TM2 domain-containing protein [Commensalibacter papalotli (ex Botero et al. 2024)]|nr:NINE protein [Commensalibacter papalotli (ex Botero et al. 2024)]CAI3936989.1 TM2 domain [Commensalibacter papalotli (ex Botero et al. 2024)]